MKIDESNYISELKRKNSKALEYIYSKYVGLVYKVVFDLLKDTASRQDIEECVSDIFISLWKNAKKKKQASAIYSKHIFSPKVVALSIWKVGSKPDSSILKNAKSITIGNTTAYWMEYKKYRIPIGTYNKMTQQQKDKLHEDMKNGKVTLQLHGGSIWGDNGKEEVKITHTLKWTENDVNYQLTDSDYGLSFEQMSKMADSIITLK